MSASSRPKACIACAKSKRKCDKQLPECQRCLDRDVDCIYPQPKRRRRNPIPRIVQTEGISATQYYAETDGLGASLDFGAWGALEAIDLDFPLSDAIDAYIPTLSVPVVSIPSQESVLDSSDVSSTPCPWFLEDETWAMLHCNQELACATRVELEAFVRIVEEMLQSWVSKGYNSFLHRRLYEKGMPTCIQDAFTTLTAYLHRTPAVKETILQIVKERSSALTKQSAPTAGGAQGILAHLARVQALFVYQFIGLFDSSIPLRASAEQKIPLLRRWVIEMWEAVRRYRGEDTSLGQRPLQWTANEFDREYDVSSEMWRLWILTESVRRSHITIDTVANVYEVMTKGRADCAGGVMFTARRGLWEAESAVKWFDLCCAKPPLLTPSLQPGSLISQYTAEEVDEFAKMYWEFIVGTDKMRSWKDKSTRQAVHNFS